MCLWDADKGLFHENHDLWLLDMDMHTFWLYCQKGKPLELEYQLDLARAIKWTWVRTASDT